MMKWIRLTGLVMGVLLLSACGSEVEQGYVSYDDSESMSTVESMAVDQATVLTKVTFGDGPVRSYLEGQGSAFNVVDPTAGERKIIFNASISIITEQFGDAREQVGTLVERHNGYIASSSERGDTGRSRVANWSIRVPVDAFDAFVGDTAELGDIERRETTSREVTAEFIDLEARLRNKLSEEERLLEHLKTSNSALKDILQIEAELSRVRGEVERLQGQLRYLTHVTSLSTVDLQIREIGRFEPATNEASGFGPRIGRTWGGSIGGIGRLFQSIVVGIVASVPWIVLIALVGLPIYRVARRWRRRIVAEV